MMDTRTLDKLTKILKKKVPSVKIGILGNSSRTGAGSNVEIGAKHEFGLDGMPQRSFLKVPIAEKLEKYLEKAGAFDKDTMKRAVASGSLVQFMKKIGGVSEAIVSDAFDSGGFGKWKQWSIPGYSNNTGNILVDTQQLRNSITSEVKE